MLYSLDHTNLFRYYQHVVLVQTLMKWCMKRLQTSNVSISTSKKKKFRSKNHIFTVNSPLILVPATIADADIVLMLTLEVLSLSRLKNVCITCQWNFNNIVWSKVHDILNFVKKRGFFYNHFWQNVSTPFWKTFLSSSNCLMLNY